MTPPASEPMAAQESPPVRQFTFVRGLDLALDGAPDQVISDGPPVASVALLGRDYPGLRPDFAVEEGARVELGQPLFADRKRPEIVFAAPGAGVVRRIERGPRRSLAAVVIELEGEAEATFAAHDPERLAALGREEVAATLLASGLWTAFRTRPFGRIPDPGSEPASIFVTAIDSNPLAADPRVVIAEARDDFGYGLDVLARLTGGPVFLCQGPGAALPPRSSGRVEAVAFDGPHPAGLAGTHIHYLDPVGRGERTVWHVGYQDVIAIGRLLVAGRLATERVVALAGPAARRPRLLRTRPGAAIADLIEGEAAEDGRVLSGSVLTGHAAAGPEAFLGRYHTQVTLLGRPAERVPSRLSPAALLSAWLARRRAGRPAPVPVGGGTTMVPVEAFERVMPLDLLPLPLLRALLVGDTETARRLGCLELDSEDLALCSYVCPGRNDYGALLRAGLDELWKQER